jgi:hypothetical protein
MSAPSRCGTDAAEDIEHGLTVATVSRLVRLVRHQPGPARPRTLASALV